MWRDVCLTAGEWRVVDDVGWKEEGKKRVQLKWQKVEEEISLTCGASLVRLFVFLSNSLRNLHGCWQANAAGKGLCLYLSVQSGVFSTGSVVNLHWLTQSLAHHPILIRVLITVPIGNRLHDVNLLVEKLVNYQSLFVCHYLICALYSLLLISECLWNWGLLLEKHVSTEDRARNLPSSLETCWVVSLGPSDNMSLIG